MSEIPKRPIDTLTRPFHIFAANKLAGAILLMVAAVAAVVWANSPVAETYHHLLHTEVEVGFGEAVLGKHLLHWINDGLMGIFFFLVGLEIKREVKAGELSTVRKAALPAFAAIGGMVVPALFYVAFNVGGDGMSGWGIPMATDIAFALGVLALLGDRVPTALKVFLTALAIVDDIGAVLVIAIFYTDTIALVSLVVGIVLYGVSIAMNRVHVRSAVAYFIVGTLVWLAFLQSGVHATIAALIMAFTIPSRTTIDGDSFIRKLEVLLRKLRETGVPRDRAMNTVEQQHLLEEMNHTIDHASAPLLRIEHAIAPLVTFLVLPIFALANAGVTLAGEDTNIVASFTDPVALGIIAGLFLGKQVGITLFSWVAVKLGLADLPTGVRWMHVYGVAMLGGVGFTMSLFIGGLAFPDPKMLEVAKIGILSASLLSGVVGYTVLRFAFAGPSQTSEAEASPAAGE